MSLQYFSDHGHSVNRPGAIVGGVVQSCYKLLEAARYKSLFTGVLILVFFTLGVPAAFAATNGGVCMVDRFNTVQGKSNDDLNCTSNDVSLAIYQVVEGPSECLAGETILVKLKGDFMATSAERWDVGVFISEDGGDPNSTGGICYSDFLNPVSANNGDLDLSGGTGPFYNGEITEDPADSCGDIQQGNDASFITDWVSIQCQDSDGDTIADVASCTVWASSASDGTANKPSCSDEFDVSAETTAKCTCDDVNIVGIDFIQTAEIEVVKSLAPGDDSGLFNLQIDAEDKVTDVSNGGTTGAVTVGAGTSNHPGEPTRSVKRQDHSQVLIPIFPVSNV